MPKQIGVSLLSDTPPTEVETGEIVCHLRSLAEGMLDDHCLKYIGTPSVKGITARNHMPGEVSLCRTLAVDGSGI